MLLQSQNDLCLGLNADASCVHTTPAIDDAPLGEKSQKERRGDGILTRVACEWVSHLESGDVLARGLCLEVMDEGSFEG